VLLSSYLSQVLPAIHSLFLLSFFFSGSRKWCEHHQFYEILQSLKYNFIFTDDFYLSLLLFQLWIWLLHFSSFFPGRFHWVSLHYCPKFGFFAPLNDFTLECHHFFSLFLLWIVFWISKHQVFKFSSFSFLISLWMMTHFCSANDDCVIRIRLEWLFGTHTGFHQYMFLLYFFTHPTSFFPKSSLPMGSVLPTQYQQFRRWDYPLKSGQSNMDSGTKQGLVWVKAVIWASGHFITSMGMMVDMYDAVWTTKWKNQNKTEKLRRKNQLTQQQRQKFTENKEWEMGDFKPEQHEWFLS
jgi:hypothetical protein